MSQRRSATIGFGIAVLAGLGIGWWLAMAHDESHREALFSPYVHRRYAALGSIAAEDDPATIGLLQDYIAWERVGGLRARAERIVVALSRAA